ncbi:efflux RND transporter periplasmic adaptor subunit [Paenibacillus sp. FSL K6-3166]|uniref:efflux RND transporter periplasmic adaptor subunit n=1 Tax=unclassified Paenibacillus TaxID=185978 RepID=UPI000B9FCD00|nr:efflux RND transporter periplasmic adaptor subunit [Paenibacillus sp. VTT E-133291]OZQ98513.1 RND transporter [Paenibacillus sp. VTT E-133291]
MELGIEPTDRRRKRNIQVVFMVFMGLLLFFTVFSNTIQSLTLPKVRTEKPSKGNLLLTIEASGILHPLAEAKLSNTTGLKVQQILVKEGQRVEKGQKLIIYESKTAEQELKDEITNLEKLKIDQQNRQDQYIQSALEEDEFKIRNARRDIEKGKLDILAQENKISGLKNRLTSEKQLFSPFDGLISKLNAVEGLISLGEPEVIVSNSSQGYRLDIIMDSAHLSSLGISTGEKVEVDVDMSHGQEAQTISGSIEEIVNSESRIDSSSSNDSGKTQTIPQKALRIKVVDLELKGGEQARVKFEKRSLQEGLLLSKEAIHEDREGLFVYKVDEQRGALGNVFVAKKVRIHSSEKNEKETMIQSDVLYVEDSIILESSEPLEDGNRVRLQ